jgi:hypothetical protein
MFVVAHAGRAWGWRGFLELRSLHLAYVQASPSLPGRVDRGVQTEPLAHQQQEPQSQSAQPQAAQAAAEAQAREHSARPPARDRRQVSQDSFQLLWREYQQLAHSTEQARTRSQQQGRNMATPQYLTAMDAQLAYDKPKGTSAIFVSLLCPSADALIVPKLLGLVFKVHLLLSKAFAKLCFLAVPAWLWLMRHELELGHSADARLLLVVGLVLLVSAGVALSTPSASSQQSGAITAETLAAKIKPPAAPSRAAAPAAGAASSGQRGSAFAGQSAQSATAAALGGAGQQPAGGRGYPHDAQDPVIKQVGGARGRSEV